MSSEDKKCTGGVGGRQSRRACILIYVGKGERKLKRFYTLRKYKKKAEQNNRTTQNGDRVESLTFTNVRVCSKFK